MPGAAFGCGGGQGDGTGIAVQSTPPRLPQVVDLGGPVLAAPKVQPILYAADANGSDLQAFLAELAGTAYWGQATSEYGVG